MSCDCADDHCEHWQARESRFRAATERITALPPVKRCPDCFLVLTLCECEDEHDELMLSAYGPLS